jgi:hypothetical protein
MNRREFVVAAAAFPLALRAGHGLAGGLPLALVTADTEAHVAAVEVATGRIYRRIATLADPRSIEAVGTFAVVAHWTPGAVSIIDAPSLNVRHVVHGFGEPRYSAGSRDGRFAYVTDSGHAGVAVVDLAGGRIVGRVRLSGWPRHVSIDPSGRLLWVALGTASRELAVVDVRRPTRPDLIGKIRPPFLAHDVRFAPDGRHVWVTSGDVGAVAIHDVHSHALVKQLAAAAPPQHVTFLGDAAYVTSGNDGTLRVHAREGRLLSTTAVPIGSYNVQQGWGRVLTPSLERGTLCVLDAQGAVVVRSQVARSCHDACFVMTA